MKKIPDLLGDVFMVSIIKDIIYEIKDREITKVTLRGRILKLRKPIPFDEEAVLTCFGLYILDVCLEQVEKRIPLEDLILTKEIPKGGKTVESTKNVKDKKHWPSKGKYILWDDDLALIKKLLVTPMTTKELKELVPFGRNRLREYIAYLKSKGIIRMVNHTNMLTGRNKEIVK